VAFFHSSRVDGTPRPGGQDRQRDEGDVVKVFGWRRPRRGAVGWESTRETHAEAIAYLDEFVATRRGVEVYVEPATAVVETSVALVAADGEWTRRRIGSPKAAAAFAKRHSIPVYDTAAVGYPPRMRAWTAEQAAKRRAPRP
jgi:hypothetical protein